MLQRFFNNNDFDIFNNDMFFPNMFTNGKVENVPPVNISEDSNGFNIEMAAPGYNKADFKVNVDKDVLTISAEKKQETENGDKKAKNYRREFCFSRFQRSFTLPAGVDSDKISGCYENGILKLQVPHAVEMAKKAIEIK